MSEGWFEGDACRRNGCDGHIELSPRENCSCHINPPCHYCTSRYLLCPVCGWEEPDDVKSYVVNDYSVKERGGVYQAWKPRPLDNSKIDWRNLPHTNSSMIKEGVYPEGTSAEEVRKAVNGTFGGRFEYFGNGKFRFVAYTD